MQNPFFILSLPSIAGVLYAAARAIVAAAVCFVVVLPVTGAHGQCAACQKEGWAQLVMNGEGTLTRPDVAIYDYHINIDVLNIVDGLPQVIDGFATSAPTHVMIPVPTFTRLETVEHGIQHLQPWRVHWSNPGWQGEFTLDFAACGGKVEISTVSATTGFAERDTYKLPDILNGEFWVRMKFEDEDSKPGDFKSSISGGMDSAVSQSPPNFNLAVNLGSVGTGGPAGSIALSEDIFTLLQAPDFGSHVIDKTRANVDWDQSTVTPGAGTITKKNTSIVIGKVVNFTSLQK